MEVPAVFLPRTTAPATTAIARGESRPPCPPSHQPQLGQKTAGGGVQAGGMWDVTRGGTGGRWQHPCGNGREAQLMSGTYGGDRLSIVKVAEDG